MHDAKEEILQLKEQGNLKQAGIGQGVAKIVDEQHRGDFHKWIDKPSECPPHVFALYKVLTNLRHGLNQYDPSCY